MNFLNKKIFNSADRFIGVDLSDVSVKVLELEKNGKILKVRSFSESSVSGGAIDNCVVIKKNEVADAIKRALNKASPKKISSKKTILSLSESKAFLRVVNIPKMRKEEAGEAIKWEIEASIPLSIDQVYYDWQFIEGKVEGDKQSVLTVAVSREISDKLIAAVELAGLEVYAIEIESVASVRSLVHDEEKGATLIVDLGAKRTSFIIAKGSIPLFTSSIPFSSESLTDAIVKYLNVTYQEAEEIKIQKGISNLDEDSMIFSALQPSLSNLVSELEKTIDFYVNMDGGDEKIEKIILCGGGSNLKGIIPYISKSLSMEVEQGDPWTNLNMGQSLPPISREKSSSYATVVGLAMREIDYEN